MTPTRWIVIGIILFVVLLILTNDHLRCTLTFGQYLPGIWDIPDRCVY